MKFLLKTALVSVAALFAAAPSALATPGDDARLVVNQGTVPAGYFSSAPTCGMEERAIGGGTVIAAGVGNYVIGSGPLDTLGNQIGDGDVANRWFDAGYNGTGTNQPVYEFAICSASTDATVRIAGVTLPAAGIGPVPSYGDQFIRCPTGQRAIGGGVFFTDLGSQYERVEASGPLDETGGTANTTTGDVARYWYAQVRNFDTGSGRTAKVYAVCSATSNATVVSSTLDFNTENGKYLECPAGSRALGGGAVSPTNNRQFIEFSYPVPAAGPDPFETGNPPVGWATQVNNFSGSTATENFSLICEPPTPPPPSPGVSSAATGQRAAALKKCKRKRGKGRKRCRRRAARLPI